MGFLADHVKKKRELNNEIFFTGKKIILVGSFVMLGAFGSHAMAKDSDVSPREQVFFIVSQKNI